MPITVDDLKATLANQGGAGSRTAVELPTERLEANLEEAQAEVEGRLAGFDVPTDPPALVRTIVLGIAAYLATLEYFGSQQLEQRDPAVLRYERAKELLERIATGKIVLDDLPPKGPPGTVGDGAPAAYDSMPSVGLATGMAADQHTYRQTMPPYHGGLTWG